MAALPDVGAPPRAGGRMRKCARCKWPVPRRAGQPPMSRWSLARIPINPPPCTQALIEAGIRRVVVGATDPNPKVNGSGIARLREAGIEILENILQKECASVISGFALAMTERRPLIKLKLASSLDGKIATSSGEIPMDYRGILTSRRTCHARPARCRAGRRRHRAGG